MVTCRLTNICILRSTAWTFLSLLLTLQSTAQPVRSDYDESLSSVPGGADLADMTWRDDGVPNSTGLQSENDFDWLTAALKRIPDPATFSAISSLPWSEAAAGYNSKIRNNKRALGIEIPDIFISHGDHPKPPNAHMTLAPKMPFSMNINLGGMRKLAAKMSKSGRCVALYDLNKARCHSKPHPDNPAAQYAVKTDPDHPT